jgi:hypothetical protein
MRHTKKMHGETFICWECDKCHSELWPEEEDIYQVGDEHYCEYCLLSKFRKDMMYASFED